MREDVEWLPPPPRARARGKHIPINRAALDRLKCCFMGCPGSPVGIFMVDGGLNKDAVQALCDQHVIKERGGGTELELILGKWP